MILETQEPTYTEEPTQEEIKQQEKDNKAYSQFREEDLLREFEQDLKYKIEVFLKTFSKIKRESIICNEIILSSDKDYIHLSFFNLVSHRKSQKFIEIDNKFIPFLYSYEKDKTYKIIENTLNKIKVLK